MKCFVFHTWGDWMDVGQGTLLVPGTNRVSGYYIRQERRCIMCGKVQIRTATT